MTFVEHSLFLVIFIYLVGEEEEKKTTKTKWHKHNRHLQMKIQQQNNIYLSVITECNDTIIHLYYNSTKIQ